MFFCNSINALIGRLFVQIVCSPREKILSWPPEMFAVHMKRWISWSPAWNVQTLQAFFTLRTQKCNRDVINFAILETGNFALIWHQRFNFFFLRLPRELLDTDLSDGGSLEFSTDDMMRTRRVSGKIEPKYGRRSKTLFSAAGGPVDGWWGK